jgi:hypothetical protein
MENLTRIAPLGLRFLDDVGLDLVRAGLEVVAWPELQPSLRRRAVANTSGVWVFASLPGMRAFEAGRGDDDYWQRVGTDTDLEFGARRWFMVEIRDLLSRFSPLRLRLRLPIRAIYTWPPPELAASAPPQPDLLFPGALPLFSAASRPITGRATLRAELEHEASGRPAGGALVEVLSGSTLLGRGLSDPQGRVLVAFPYPEPEPLMEGSVSSPVYPPLSSLTWELSIHVRWRDPGADVEENPPPSVLTHVFEQPTVTALESRTPPRELATAILHHAKELVLRSVDSPQGRLSLRTDP